MSQAPLCLLLEKSIFKALSIVPRCLMKTAAVVSIIAVIIMFVTLLPQTDCKFFEVSIIL